MKKIVSFFADHSETFDQLNRQAADHARALGYDYRWEPQSPFQADQVIAALKEADVGIIDVEPYGEEIFKEIQGHTKLLVRFGVGFDKVDLAAASRHGIAIARTTAANASGVAEMALSLILPPAGACGTTASTASTPASGTAMSITRPPGPPWAS